MIIADLNLKFSVPKRIETKRGPRMLSKAKPTEAFWEMWRNGKSDEIKALGISVSEYQGNWSVCLWQEIDAATVKHESEQREASRQTDAQIDIPHPDGLDYLPFQRAGIAYALGRQNCLIADEMGLGKTIQAIGVINADETIKRVIVICPNSLKLNWQREMEKWLTRKMSISIADSKQLRSTDIVIVNYDVLGKHDFAASDYDLAILDEAHYIKNKKAKRSELARAITDKARRKLLLTGTPILNKPIELFNLVNMLDPQTWDNVFRYAKRYCAGFQSRWGWDFTGASNLEELQDQLRATIMVRRLKKDVLTELPPKRRQIIELSANGASGAVQRETAAWERQEERLAALRQRAEMARAGESDIDYTTAVDALRDAAQASFAEISKLRHATALAKVDDVIEHVEQAIESSGKVVVMAHHHDVIDKIKSAFGDAAVVLTGETALADRQAAVDRFQTDPTCTLFIGSITAAGVGITLTAASHMIFAELDWVPGNISQAEDRIHRIGQTDSVLIQHVVLEDSLDARMAKTLVRKQEIMDKALDSLERAEVIAEPLLPHTKSDRVETPTRKKIGEIAEKLTSEQAKQIHLGLKCLAAMCDGANAIDGHGFNKFDTTLGHELAELPAISRRQAALGYTLVRKHRKQISEIYEKIGDVNGKE
jgi:SWI/SNF-related matrix-associated actin-dependent regulator 1 of chromatin subfamily A